MATFRYSGPNGESYKIEAATEADAMAVLAEAGISDEPPPPPVTVPLEGGRAPREAREAEPTREQKKEAYKEQYRGVSQRMGQAGETANTLARAISRANPFSDDIQAGMNYMRDLHPGDSYQDYLDRQRAMNEVSDERAPITSIGGQIVGGAAIPVGLAGTGVKGAIKGGAALGAAYGAGQGDDLGDRAEKAVAGGILGGTVGGAITAGANKIIDTVAARSAARMAQPAAAPANEAVEAGGRMGVPVPRFLATDSTAIRSGAQVARNAPIGGAAIDDAATQFLDDVGGAAKRVGNMASSGGVLKDRATIGDSIRKSAMSAIDDMDVKADDAYKLLRSAINPDKPVDVTAKVAPLLNRVMKARAAAGEGELGGYLTVAADLMTRPGGVTFNGLQRARSQLGKAIDWDAARGGMSVGDLKQLYGSMTDALDTAVRMSAKNKSRATRASNLLKAADRRYAETADSTAQLSRMFGDAVPDEKIVDKVLSMASDKAGGNIRQLRALKGTIGQGNFQDLSGYVIDRMGRNSAGEFSGAIFASNLEKMAPAAQREIFGSGPIFDAVQDLRKLSDVYKRADAFSNKSQTGRTTGMVALGAGLIADPVTAVASALGARTFAQIMSKPATAQNLGQWAKTTAKLQGGLEKGTIASTRTFEKMSRVYAGKIAAEMGVPANDVARALLGSVKSAAEGEQQQRAQ